MKRSYVTTAMSFMLAGSALLAACGGEAGTDQADAIGALQEAYAIADYERPEDLVASASRRLADNITAADIGRDFGVPDSKIPYPDTYWPFVDEGTDARWNPTAADARSPIEKFMAITRPSSLAKAKAWEHTNHGAGVPEVADWFGHCPGWTGASMANAPILHAVFAKSNGAGGITSCTEGQAGCVRFEIGDVNALMAEVYNDGDYAFIGARCDTSPAEIPRDASGRVTKDGCRGVNAGSLLVVASTLMKQAHLPFAIDAQTPTNTDQIWNQPAYRYHVYDFQPLTEAQAANLVAHGTKTGAETRYRWNADAHGFAFVDLGLKWVTEHGPNRTTYSGSRSTRETRVMAVIELSADASNPSATILGGEYLDIARTSSNRLTVPPFLWVINAAGQDNLPTTVNGDYHNPYIQPSVVKQLIALGQR